MTHGAALYLALDALDREHAIGGHLSDDASPWTYAVLRDGIEALRGTVPEDQWSHPTLALVLARRAAVLATAEALARHHDGPPWRTAGSPWEDRHELVEELREELALFHSALLSSRIARVLVDPELHDDDAESDRREQREGERGDGEAT